VGERSRQEDAQAMKAAVVHSAARYDAGDVQWPTAGRDT
jgi:hypothetical protein